MGGDENSAFLASAYTYESLRLSYQALFVRTGGGDAELIAQQALDAAEEATRRGSLLDAGWGRYNPMMAAVHMNLDMLEEVVALAAESHAQPTGPFGSYFEVMDDFTVGVALHLLGRHDEALRASERMVDAMPALPETYTWFVPLIVLLRAIALAAADRAAEARAYVREALPNLNELRVPFVMNSAVIGLATLAAVEGDWKLAAVLHTATLAAGGLFRSWTDFALYRYYGRWIEERLNAETLTQCREQGASMTLVEALELGLDMIGSP
jgi:tetratricopeptide (TPR) repeat protein